MITQKQLTHIYTETAKARQLDDILSDPGMPDILSLQKHMRDNPEEMKRYRATKSAQRAMIDADPKLADKAAASRLKGHEERIRGKEANRNSD